MKKKIAEVQEFKQVSSTVELDLEKLTGCITQLEEILIEEEFCAGDVHSKIEEIEELASAIANGVIDISSPTE